MQIGMSHRRIPDDGPDCSVGVILACLDTEDGPQVSMSVKLDSPPMMFTFCIPADVADNLAARIAVELPRVAKECREVRNGARLLSDIQGERDDDEGECTGHCQTHCPGGDHA